ncbi:MAG: NTP transferase domain-containing protein [Bacteroidia bacterium]|nr:NTP transferase domain-containing protein [Bacteroidia bacterium]
MSKNSAVVILSGGNSERMNFPKCFLPFENKTLIEYIVDTYSNASIKNIIVVLNSNFINIQFADIIEKVKKKAVIVVNNKPELGRMFSIKAGLKKIKKNDFCFIQNIDNPAISVELIDKITGAAKADSYISPVYKGKSGHPVLLSKSIINKILLNSKNNMTLKDILHSFNKIEVDSGSLNVIENVNSPEDWEKFKETIQQNAKHS